MVAVAQKTQMHTRPNTNK